VARTRGTWTFGTPSSAWGRSTSRPSFRAWTPPRTSPRRTLFYYGMTRVRTSTAHLLSSAARRAARRHPIWNSVEDLTEWIGSVDETGNVVISVEEYNALEDTAGYEEIIDNYTKTVTTHPGTQLFIYGQEVDDFVFVKKDAIWTIATAALQEVDRQLQDTKTPTRLGHGETRCPRKPLEKFLPLY
jgi:hypothetical protein